MQVVIVCMVVCVCCVHMGGGGGGGMGGINFFVCFLDVMRKTLNQVL